MLSLYKDSLLWFSARGLAGPPAWPTLCSLSASTQPPGFNVSSPSETPSLTPSLGQVPCLYPQNAWVSLIMTPIMLSCNCLVSNLSLPRDCEPQEDRVSTSLGHCGEPRTPSMGPSTQWVLTPHFLGRKLCSLMTPPHLGALAPSPVKWGETPPHPRRRGNDREGRATALAVTRSRDIANAACPLTSGLGGVDTRISGGWGPSLRSGSGQDPDPQRVSQMSPGPQGP